jgi:hypothetical protein
MADLSDITAYLETAVTAAVYPNGTSQPSVANMDVRIFEGWPLPDQLDRDMGGTMLTGTPPVVTTRPNGPLSNVSIYPMAGMNASVYQILDNTYIISMPVFGLAITLVGQVLTITGTPSVGEYVTIEADRTFVYSRTGASAAAIITALVADIAVNYPGVTSTSSTITMPNTFALLVRHGGVGVLGKVTHRQKQSIMVSVWAPNHRARTALASALDNALKQNIRITMPDTSQVVICYNRTNFSDEKQLATIYRRDLIYDAEYATVFQFPGYMITSVDTSIANYNNTAIQPAIT